RDQCGIACLADRSRCAIRSIPNIDLPPAACGASMGRNIGRFAMIVTVFRSRLMPGVRDEYLVLAERMNEIAKTMPGYISHKGFFADDGERVTIVEFESEEGMRAWRM